MIAAIEKEATAVKVEMAIDLATTIGPETGLEMDLPETVIGRLLAV